MIARTKHNAGFTLAELLIVIAIILVLAALAIPSIITAQNNMRMLELNNAAESIANAAQTQMTAKKVAGSWLALVENDDGKNVYPAAKNATDEDIRYMVASSSGSGTAAVEGARDNDIIPSLSIDDGVRNGDYVIVFKKSTASVVAVYYTDGKTGFFGSSPQGGTTAAQIYYENEGASTDQTTRMNHSPMIGYYEGTPANATNEVALKKPVIWVSEEGILCIQNANLLGDNKKMNTALEATISKKDDSSVAFKISGLDETAQSCVVSKNDGSDGLLISNSGKIIYKLVSKDVATSSTTTPDAATPSGDVFAIDLNELKKAIDEKADAVELAMVIDQFEAGNDIETNARVFSVSPSIPVTARAYIQWPGKVAKLSLYITNPALDSVKNEDHATAKHIEGTYNAPEVKMVAASGADIVTGIEIQPDSETFAVKANDVIKNENIEATRQAYSGGWVRLAKAYEQKANVKATVGSYSTKPLTADDGTIIAAGTTHQYQIYEMWVSRGDERERVGYLSKNAWVWEESDAADTFKNCVIGLDGGNVTTNVTSVTIDVEKLYESIENPDDEGYGVYLRTTPNLEEVQKFFSSEAETKAIAGELSWDSQNGVKVGRTGCRGQNHGKGIRMAFENEFGAPSTVASWSATSYQGESEMSSIAGKAFPASGDLRIYYSATPAIAWGDGSYSGNSLYTALPSAVLWLFEKQTGGSFANQPAAFVRDSRLGPDNNFALTKSGSADFEIPTERDYLFYRVLCYCDEDGNRLADFKQQDQYVPYTAQDDAAYATIAPGPTKEGYIFTGWKVESAYTYNNGEKTLSIPAGAKVSDYDNILAFGPVVLKAQYVKVGVGLIYAEFGDGGNLVGWAGYISNSQGEFEGNKLTKYGVEIASFGYYVVVSHGQVPTTVNANDYQERSLQKQHENVDLVGDGAGYDLYRIGGYSSASVNGYSPMRRESRTVTYRCGDQEETYTFNLNFAAAVVKKGDESVDSPSDWGTEQSPWIVRHGMQFPGALPWNEQGNSVQAAYQNACFKQTNDIDMAVTTASLANKYEWTFRGSYDGQGFYILNLHSRFLAGGAGIRMQDTNTIAWGLFTCAVGASKEKPCRLSNVIIKESPGEWSMAASIGFSVGMLVGYTENCEIERCQVQGSGATVSMASSYNSGPACVGGLAGEVVSSVIRDSSVDNLDLKLSANSNWIKIPCIGALAGRMSDSTISSSEGIPILVASDVTLTISTAPKPGSGMLSFGGVVGIADDSQDTSKIINCYARRVSMSGPVQTGKEVTAYFGRYVGTYYGTGDPISGNGYPESITYRYGEDPEPYQSVENDIGGRS
ncbi:type II secretion system protein [Gordonibacter massiliensis (ex Traore et al. 2017)]|uniref:type II secretion system protein n=1 Tax=Gordonibacter massiliensis (ex Traore et al. 2017) TaxID=1841863 RepID=UPI001C8C93BE|nr:prepilin-type N-terminal cleavage/methylation domain-containing protein [Gordonibacter massiliensis (ex Traore et al. 2017)]